MQHTAFKRRESFKDVLCRRYYAERVVASFANKIQSEYYSGNISVSIEGIALEHFRAFTKGRYQVIYNITSASCSVSLFFIWRQQTGCCYYYRTHQTIDTIAQEKQVLTTSLSTIWENTDRCAEQYRCASALYLMSVISQTYY